MSHFPPFTVFDVETTGLDPLKGHKIVEIAGVRIEDGAIHEDKAFVQLVNPERTIPPDAAQINNIRDEDVAVAPTIDKVLPEFLEFSKGSVLIAHNCDFDMGFLRVEKDLCWGYIDLPECLCTMRLSRALYPSEFRHSLDVLCHRLSLTMPKDRHRALPDVLLTAQALLIMIADGNVGSIDDLRVKAGRMKLAA